MVKYPIEVINIGFPKTDAIENAIYILNQYQDTFSFVLLRNEKFETYEAQHVDHFKSRELYDLMDKVFMDLKGIHHFTIGVVEKRLAGKNLPNLFSSMDTNENGRYTGKAITTSYQTDQLLYPIPVEIYYIFEFLSISIRFIVGIGMIHDRERGCLFHRKIQKKDILDVIRDGYISRESQKLINEYLEVEQIISFNTLIRIISAVARSADPKKSFDAYLVQDSSKNKSNKRTTIFISYSHADETWLNRLKPHIKLLERKGLINSWDDTQIKAGALWRKEIENALSTAKVAILLVSVDYLSSDFIIENELPSLLTAAEKEGSIILPVIVRPCAFAVSELSLFQCVNSPSKALSGMTEHEQEQTFVKVTESIMAALDKL
ncbi:MAG: toll/interleukin-1 receptor domain-containing protein [Anaerolineales bacterium]|nr:toll/interleukin-1 receptor domain-containing protein [Anaerolineales bacterium]